MSKVVKSRESEAADELTVTEGDDIKVTGGNPKPPGWLIVEDAEGNLMQVPAECVEVTERPVR